MMNPEPERMILRMIESFESRMQADGCAVARCTVSPESFETLHERDADAIVVINPNPRPPIVCSANQLVTVINTALETPVAMSGRFDVVSVDHLRIGEQQRAVGAGPERGHLR